MGKATYTYKQLAGLVAMHVSKAHPIPIRPIANVSEITGSECVICGLPGHSHTSCREKCSDCGLNFCEGARRNVRLPCNVAATAPPANVKNGRGKPLPDLLFKKLAKAHGQRHGTTVSAAEAAELMASATSASSAEVVWAGHADTPRLGAS